MSNGEFYSEKLHFGNALDSMLTHGIGGKNNKSNVLGPEMERDIQNHVHAEALKAGRDGSAFRDKQWRHNLRRRIRAGRVAIPKGAK